MPPRVPCRSGMSIYGSGHSQAENSSYLTNRSASHAPLAETPAYPRQCRHQTERRHRGPETNELSHADHLV